MERIWKSLLAGIVVAVGGLVVSDFFGTVFNGMDYGSASVMGICMYLCVVIVTCTGVIVSKIDRNLHTEKSCNE